MGCAAKNSGVIRLRIASLATALAPFSQNSAVLRSSSGSGQAQLGQSNPSFWLSVSRVLKLRETPMSRPPRRTVSQIELRPAALRSRLPVSGGRASGGGSAPATPVARCALAARARSSACLGTLFSSCGSSTSASSLRISPNR